MRKQMSQGGVQMNIERIWGNIRTHEGEVFYTKRGKPFTYRATDRLVVLQNTNRNIPIGDFAKALKIANPSVVKIQQMNLQGPSYLYGIISDPRIVP